MPEIAGYTDMQYIKGQYYRLAAAPKPVVYTGNIDTISEELLTKAMFVFKAQASGTFPNDFGTIFLITTVKYGNDTYLQTAYMGPESGGFESWEYRRIYSNGEWTEWIGTDSYITDVDNKIQDVKDTADGAVASIDSINGQVSNLSSSVKGLNNSVGALSGQISSVSNRVSTVESRTVNCGKDAIKLWSGSMKSGSISFDYGVYKAYLIVGAVRHGGSKVSQYHVKPQITTSDVTYQINDEDEYYIYKLRYSGASVILTFVSRSATYQGGGELQEVWGIY